MVRAKMKCSSAAKQEEFGGDTVVRLDAVYSSDPNSENKSFSDYTPSASVIMTISKGKPAADQFVVGAEYYVDFTKVE